MSDVDIAIERCIPIPGRGTVVVGTVVAGTISVGNTYELRGVSARCDGIEVGRQLLQRATEGERVGILFPAVFPDH